MKRLLFPVVLVILFSSCSRHGIIKSSAYVRESVTGTVRRDDNGRQLNSGIITEHLIYIETDSSKGSLKWETAWVDQKPYSIQPIAVTNGQTIGQTMDGKDVIIQAKDGNQLWQLVLKPKQESVDNPDLQKKINTAKILLTGMWKNKPFAYEISKEQQLQRLEFQ